MYDSNALVAVIAGVVCVLVSAPLYIAWRRRNTPAEKERRRRQQVNAQGRITDGTVTDFLPLDGDPENGALIHYTYSIGGVEYSAAQDVSTLLDLIGNDPSRWFGSVNIKYHTRNPSNSIVICEEWSGFRTSSLEQRVS